MGRSRRRTCRSNNVGAVHAAQRGAAAVNDCASCTISAGTGELGSRDLDQLVASQGGSYVQAGGGFGAPPAGRRDAALQPVDVARRGRPAGGCCAAPPVVGATGMPAVDPTVSTWYASARRDAARQDRARVIMTHSAGVHSAGSSRIRRPCQRHCRDRRRRPAVWRRQRVGHVVDSRRLRSLVSDPSEIKRNGSTPGAGRQRLFAAEEPARKLKNLQTFRSSSSQPSVVRLARQPGGVAYFKQAGCKAEEMRLVRSASTATAT